MAHTPDDNSSSWLDDALRDVPLPPDLVSRLRRLGADSDHRLDSALADVAVPGNLLVQLKLIPDDSLLDRRLLDVPLPLGLPDRLKALASGPADQSASPTARESYKWPAIAAPGPFRTAVILRSMRRAYPWVVAASLLLAASFAGYGLWSQRDQIFVVNVDQSVASSLGLLDNGEKLALPLTVKNGLEFQSLEAPNGTRPQDPGLLEKQRTRTPSELLSTAGSSESRPLADRFDPLLDATFDPGERLAMPDRSYELPKLDMVTQNVADGIDPPSDPGFDWAEFLREGVNPFVSPVKQPVLRTIQVPLKTSGGSYGRFLNLLSENERIHPDDVRTEDFLAAVDYAYAPPQNRALALYPSGGPSPWDLVGRKSLLIGVQTTGKADVVRDPIDLTLIVDGSLFSPRLDAMDACRGAVRRLAGALRGGDRISLILAAQQPIPLALDLAKEDADELSAAAALLGPQPLVDLVPALKAALQRARKEGDSARAAVVCITSGLAYISQSDQTELSRQVAAAAERGVQFNVVRLAPVSSVDPTSTQLTRMGGGYDKVAEHEHQLWRILFRELTSNSSVVAQNVSLTVEFNSEVVESYRLLGHEMPSVLRGARDQVRAVELHLGDTSVALFELNLRNGAETEVAMVRLKWIEPQSGRAEEVVRRVSRDQFATTLPEASLPLQRATIAAATAEVLRGVRHVPTEFGLDDVAALADTLHSRLWGEKWFITLVDALETTSRIGSGRPAR